MILKTILSIFIIAFFFIQATDIETIRTAYFSGPKTEASAKEFNILMEDVELSTPTLKAYYGAAVSLQAKYGSTIREKRNLFEQAVGHIEDAVKSSPDNAEIRLIRLSVQENSPGIVRYKSNMDEDKKLILEAFKDQPVSVKRCIRDYVSNSGFFSTQEKSLILD